MSIGRDRWRQIEGRAGERSHVVHQVAGYIGVIVVGNSIGFGHTLHSFSQNRVVPFHVPAVGFCIYSRRITGQLHPQPFPGNVAQSLADLPVGPRDDDMPDFHVSVRLFGKDDLVRHL